MTVLFLGSVNVLLVGFKNLFNVINDEFVCLNVLFFINFKNNVTKNRLNF